MLVEKRTDATAKNGKPFANIVLRDTTGNIDGKLWDRELTAFGDLFKEGNVVLASGTIGEYQGKLQFEIRDASYSLSDPSKFSKCTVFDVEEMWSDLVSIISGMKEPLTKFVCEELLLKEAFSAGYKKAPAAKAMHNAWVGGLLEHVHSLCTIADPIITHYQKRYCEKISRDKVLFGLLLHDAGKIVEYDHMKPTFNYTTIGKLTNHMVLGPAWVFEAANKYKEKDSIPNFKLERAHLMHVLAAHHGKEEWGSPIKPASIEAIIVHHLDNLDAKVLHALDYVKGKSGEVPGFSQKSWSEKTEFLQYT